MHKFDPRKSSRIMGLNEAQRFWHHLDAIIEQWRNSDNHVRTHIYRTMLQVHENMVEAHSFSQTTPPRLCSHHARWDKHMWLSDVDGPFCPAMQDEPCDWSPDGVVAQ